MQVEEVKALTGKFPGLSVGVLGDFALDAYWMLEDGVGELSVETGKRALVVRSQSYSPGGAGNIVTNLAALGVGRVMAFGVIGRDIWGGKLHDLLDALGPVDLSALLRQETNWDTPVWAKPHLEDQEQRRLDFGFYNSLDNSVREALLASLRAALPKLDALIVNQQLPNPLMQGGMIEAINALAAEFPQKAILVDCRLDISRYRGMLLKFNDESILRASGQEVAPDTQIGIDELRGALESTWKDYPRPILVTRGRRGSLVFETGRLTEVPAALVTGPIDPVGAGDTMVAAFSVALAAGATTPVAAELGNWAASVSVAKLRQTGTATPAEIEFRVADSFPVFRPDLAEDPRRARFIPGTRIELVNPDIQRGQIKHVIFDHDGTISTLRQGWEPIMEEVMLRSILGEAFSTVSSAEFNRVQARSREFIDQTTGIQTVLQMEGLVAMVLEFGFVPADKVLDKWGYKAIYNEMLLEMVNERLERLKAGELSCEDFTVKGAVEFLHELKRQGLHCYLASGTDLEDVVREAKRLGYADAFQAQGGIYGSVGDIEKFSKKKLVEQIIREHRLQGPQLCAFGDGPVEIREVKKVGGIAVGIASDEVQRFGLNLAKRTRLIKAGADIIIGDYTQQRQLLEYLMQK